METDCDQLLSRLTPPLRRLRYKGHGAQTAGGFTPVLNQVYLGMELGSEVSRVNDQCRVARRVSSGCAAWQKLAIVVEEVWCEARKRHRESRRAQTCESANPAAYVAARSEAVAASTRRGTRLAATAGADVMGRASSRRGDADATTRRLHEICHMPN